MFSKSLRRSPSFPFSALLVGAFVVAFLAAGCGDGRDPSPPSAESCRACAASSECAVGEVCGGGCCGPAGGMTQGCAGGLCLDPDVLCADLGGCTCRIVAPSVGASLSTPELLIAPTAGVPIRAVLSTPAGDRDDVEASLWVEGPVRLEDGILVGEATGGAASAVAMVRAAFGAAAECGVYVTNVGPVAESVRLWVRDAETGAPVPSPALLVDIDGDGLADVEPLVMTDHLEVPLGALPATPVALTITAEEFAIVTVVASVVGAADWVIPLARRQPAVAAATGALDWDAYEHAIGGGRKRSVSLAMVAPSFPLAELSSFDLGRLLGGRLPDVTCPGDIAGCYQVDLPGLFSAPVDTWGGLVMAMGAAEVKPYFEVLAAPGQRTLWTLAGQWDFADVGSVLEDLIETSNVLCECNAGPTCDGGCSCDADCRPAAMGRFLRSLPRLLPQAGFGSFGAVPLPPIEIDSLRQEWAVPYATRVDDPSLPRLDGERALAPRHSLQHYYDIAVGPLPADPAFPGHALEGVVGLALAEVHGTGYVVEGLGAAFDCGGAQCAGHRQADPAYDGLLDATPLCTLSEGCPQGWPEALPAGHLPLISVDGAVALPTAQRRVVLLALPVDSFTDADARLTGLVVEPGASRNLDVRAADYLPIPAVPSVAAGHVALHVAGADLMRLRVGESWTLYVLGDSADFVLPALPGAPHESATGGAPRLEHAAFRLRGGDGTSLLAPGGQELDDLDALVEAFSARVALPAD